MKDTDMLILSILSSSAVCFCIVVLIFIFKKEICKEIKIPLLCPKEKAGGGPGSTPTPTPSSTPVVGGATATPVGSPVTLSNYWVAQEGQKYLLDCGSKGSTKSGASAQGKEVTLGTALGGKKHALMGANKKTLAKVDAYTWDACYCEGTCHVGGKTINLQKEGSKPEFSMTNGLKWGIGNKDNQLTPFVSVTADNKYKFGDKIYISDLDGFRLPTGEVHNGCVRVDDACGDGCSANQIDFHVGVYDNYLKMKDTLKDKAHAIKRDSCVIKQYKPK